MVRFKMLGKWILPRIWRARRSRQAITVSLLTCTICLFWMSHSDWSLQKGIKCQSELNKQSAAHTPNIKVFSNTDSSRDSGADKKSRNSLSETHDHGLYNKLLVGSQCVDVPALDSPQNLKICIYDPSKDLKISFHLKNYGSWEKENVAEMMKSLEMFPNMKLVDLGSNLGVFTLQAAFAGTEVIAVDALLPNHRLLGQSLAENGLTCLVTQVHNAVHGQRGTMRIRVDPTNIGGSLVEAAPDEAIALQSQLVDSVCLDDLTPLVQGQSVFLKMDLEGSEEAVLSCADTFFRNTIVKVLMMEWTFYRHNEMAGEKIKTFLTSHDMIPTWGVDRDRVIDPDASDSWPDNVFWMRA